MVSGKPSCNLCGGKGFTVIEEDTPFRVLQCESCSLIFVYPIPDKAELEEHYDTAYYGEWLDEQKEPRIKMWKRRLKRLERFRPGGMLLDVGCAEGTFLNLARQRGWRTRGTEISRYAASYAENISGAEVFCGELPAAGYPRHSFDVITMWHVLEHVRDPSGYLREIHHILKPDGLLVIAVPNCKNVLMQAAYRIVRKRKMKLFSKDDREVHLYHFSPKTIQTYLARTGFECIRLAPDFGIVNPYKRLINAISTIPYYLAGIKIFNAIEIFAVPK
jgi:2-polyprenyl-3-methyl-5-hydroxy-6-metoxy-1,4-benzoquinol methylase